MSQAIITTYSNGGDGSDECTATANCVLKDKTYIGVDTNDETGVGTLELTGNATSDDVMAGKTFYCKDPHNKQSGTLPVHGTVSQNLNCGNTYTIPLGYHNGLSKITANSLVSQTSGNATAANILSGQTAWVNGNKLNGTMTNYGAINQSLGINDTYTIPNGYHNGSGKITQSIATLGGQTISPNHNTQTISSAGKYLTGNITIYPIPSNYYDVNSNPTVFKDGSYSPLADLGAYEKRDSGIWEAVPIKDNYIHLKTTRIDNFMGRNVYFRRFINFAPYSKIRLVIYSVGNSTNGSVAILNASGISIRYWNVIQSQAVSEREHEVYLNDACRTIGILQLSSYNPTGAGHFYVREINLIK